MVFTRLHLPEFTSETRSRSVQLFLRSPWQIFRMLYNNRPPLLRLKIAPSHQGIWTPSNSRCLGPTGVHNPNGSSIGSAVFAGLTIVTDRQTDRPCYSVCNNMPHLRTHSRPTVMRPSNNRRYSIERISSPRHVDIGTIPYPGPQPKRHVHRFSRFCRAQ